MIGILCSERGEYDRAADHLQQALAFAQGLGDPRWEAYVLLNLAVAARGRGLREEARKDVDRSLAMFPQVGDWQGTRQAGRLVAALGEAAGPRRVKSVVRRLCRYGSPTAFSWLRREGRVQMHKHPDRSGGRAADAGQSAA